MNVDTVSHQPTASPADAGAGAQDIPNQVSRGLDSPRWPVRNEAVKLVERHRLIAFLPRILEFLTDRTPASLLDRLLGGDFQQVGFIRRNAARTLGALQQWSPEIRTALLLALEDPYWEVRTAALQSLARLQETHQEIADALLPHIVERFSERNFEVVAAAIRTYGSFADTPGTVAPLEFLFYHPNRTVRLAVLDCLDLLHARDLLSRQEWTTQRRRIFIPGYRQPARD